MMGIDALEHRYACSEPRAKRRRGEGRSDDYLASAVEVLPAALSAAGLFFLEAADSFLAVGVCDHVSNAQVRMLGM